MAAKTAAEVITTVLQEVRLKIYSEYANVVENTVNGISSLKPNLHIEEE
jgi:hypothetical protein